MTYRTCWSVFLCWFAISVFTGDAFASTFTVKHDGTGDFPTITAALASVSDGDVILVESGAWYEPPLSFGGLSGVVLVAEVTGETSLNSLFPGMRIMEESGGTGELNVVQGFALRDASVEGDGAAVHVSNGSYVAFSQCVFRNNEASGGHGGAVYCSSDAMVVLDLCVFELNSASVGGAACVRSSGRDEFVHVDQCIFRGNSADIGGALVLGTEISVAGFNPHKVISCVFAGNTATMRAGAIEIYPYKDPGEKIGAGLAYIDNCTFYGNTAPVHGAIAASGTPGEDVVFCRNTILWANEGGSDSRSEEDDELRPTWDYCIVDVEHIAEYPTSEFAAATELISEDPRFANAGGDDGEVGTADDELWVLPMSPAIDDGTDAVGLTTGDDDVAGNIRRIDDPLTPDGSGTSAPAPIDRGAYEYAFALFSDIAVWTGEGTGDLFSTETNWFSDTPADSSHRWIFDGLSDGTATRVEVASVAAAFVDGLDVASGTLEVYPVIPSAGNLYVQSSTSSTDAMPIRIASFHNTEPATEVGGTAVFDFGGSRLRCSGVELGDGGGLGLIDGAWLQIFKGGCCRLDEANSGLLVSDGGRVERTGSGAEFSGLLNLGVVAIVDGELRVRDLSSSDPGYAAYAQFGERMNGEQANGILLLTYANGDSDPSVKVEGEAWLGGALMFFVLFTSDITAGDEFTVFSADSGFNGTNFDFTVTSVFDPLDELDNFFFSYSVVEYFGGGESLVATAVSLDELLSGDPESQGAAGATLRDLVLADIDGDGFDDMVLSVDLGVGVDGMVVVVPNQGNSGGTWDGFDIYDDSNPSLAVTVGKEPRGLDVGDVNGDGMLDVVVANYGDGTVSVLDNNSVPGSPILSVSLTLDADPELDFPGNSLPVDVLVRNLDQDAGNLADLLITNELDGSVISYKNTTALGGTNLAAPLKSNPPKSIQRFPPSTGGGTRDDDATGSSSDDDGASSGSVNMGFSGQGIEMVWTSYSTPIGSAPEDIVTEDFNDDGLLDIATSNAGGDSISILLGSGTGYSAATTFLLPSGMTEAVSITAGDLDADGDIDLAIVATEALLNSRVVQVLRNTLDPPLGSFGWVFDSNTSLAGDGPTLVRSADVDNDGDDDIIALVDAAAFGAVGPVAGFSATEMTANSPPEDPPCPADFNDDGFVDGADLAVVLGAWGPAKGSPADLNDDGTIDGADLATVLGAWGNCASGAS